MTPALQRLEELLAVGGHHGRGDRPPGAPAAGRDERDRPERDHEHAPDLVVRLGAVRRERQPHRRDAARPERLRRDGLRHPGSVPPRDRGDRPQLRDGRARGRPRRRGHGRCAADGRRGRRRGRRRRARPGASQRRSGLLPDLRRPARRSSARSGSGFRRRSGSAAPTCGRPRAAYLGSLALLTALVLAVPLLLSLAGGGWRSWRCSSSRSLGSGPLRTSRSRWSTAACAALLGPRSLPRLELADGVPARPAHAGRGADPARERRRRRGARRRASRSTTWPIPTATSASPCCPTGSTRPRRRRAEDDSLLAAAVAGIERLNARHGEAPGGGARFLLFHRKRRWNAGEGALDGLGAQARQAARAQRAAARAARRRTS